jgi:hypothetical protein
MLVSLVALASMPQQPTLSELVPPAMANIKYRLISPEPRIGRPPAPAFEGESYFAVVTPSGKPVWGIVNAKDLRLDLNSDGDLLDAGEVQPITRTAMPTGGAYAQIDFKEPAIEAIHFDIGLNYKKSFPAPLLGVGAEIDNVSRFSRYIMGTASKSAAAAPVYDLGEHWTFAPDYINLCGDLTKALYSPGRKVSVHMEIGTLGLGKHAFLGRTWQDIPAPAYVQAKFEFRHAKTGKTLSHLATLKGRC